MTEFDLRADTYETESRWSVCEAVAEECLKLLEGHEVGRVLDAAGGTGRLSAFLMEHREASEVVVLDESSKMLAKAPTSSTKWLGRLEDINIQHPDETFDTILLRQALHYVNDPVAVVRLLASHLREDGIIYVGQLIAPSSAAANWLSGIATKISPKRRRVYTLESLIDGMIDAGQSFLRAALIPQSDSLSDWVRRATSPIAPHVVLRDAVEGLDSKVAAELAFQLSSSDFSYCLLWFHGTFRPEEHNESSTPLIVKSEGAT